MLLAPGAAAEFGPESPDGWPVSVDGVVQRPPVEPVFAAQAQTAAPLNKAGPVTMYPYYALLVAELNRLAMDHPDLVKLSSAGKTTAGLDLWVLEIADFGNESMRPLETRERIYLDGGTHSNEYSGVYFVTEIAQFLLDEYETNETARWVVENRHTFIVPMVNPDGSHVFGRLNAKAVNVNRNFPATWGMVDEHPVLNNPGPEPASEPETQTVIALLDAIQPDYVNSIHCCGNLWLHPWGAEEIPPAADIQMFTRICDEVFAEVRDTCGPVWSTIYPASGSTADEGYARVGASSWTYEMSGRGAIAPWGQPAIVDDVRVQEREAWAGIMHALLHVEKYGARPVIQGIEGDSGVLRVEVVNEGYGNVTHGNLTLGGRTVALPPMQPGERVVLTVEGTYAPGETPVKLDWEKRIMKGPQGLLDLDATLVDVGGTLRGLLPGMDVIPLSAADAPEAKVPGPGVGLVAVALVAALLLLRRR